jgi:hypothetical protein
MNQSRINLLAVDEYQSRYFGYKKIGFLGYIMPVKMLKKYVQEKFFEQPERNQHAFTRMLEVNKRRRKRLVKLAR